MATQLRNAYIIGQENFQNWSQGFDTSNYLRVLPHPDQKIPFKDPFRDWQLDQPGNYISSWGPQEELNATLRMENIDRIQIDGFGILKSGDGKIPWLTDASNQPRNTPYEQLRGYNGTIPGPFLITEPGDTLNLWLENNLDQVTNLHTHGLHVSPMGRGDNVLHVVESGENWNQIIPIPDNHFIGPDWYHPHLHGLTNEQVSSGLAGQLLLTTPYDLPDIDKFNPKERPLHFMALNTFGVQQVNRQGSATDPLNQDPTKALPAGTPLQVLGTENGEKVYELSDAVFMGYNAKPKPYDPTRPTGGAPGIFSYGGGPLAEPTENVIHTVNGQYNPTIEVKTGEVNLFAFTNMNSNAFHIIQLFKEEGDNLVPQEVTLVAIDGDSVGSIASNAKDVTELPVLSPGQRLTVEEWFEKPGKYYFLSNGTEEIIGNNTSALIKGKDGFEDGHLIWGPQVLATVEVTGNEIPKGPRPEPYDIFLEQAQKIDELVADTKKGDFDRQRTFTWSANLGNALAIGNVPDDLDSSSFEGTYRINGEFFATEFDEGQVPLTMPMLGTTEVWSMKNTSGQSNPNLPAQLNIPLLEWHPFHIHQNDFTVLEINGIPVSDLKTAYLDGVLSDTIGLPPTYDPSQPPTVDNPFGVPMVDGEASEIKVAMNFEDFPGSYVNHCHILFHEDAGMMAPVRVVLNTEDTWLGLAGQQSNGKLDLYRASNLNQKINLSPFGAAFTGAIGLAIGDVNYKQKDNLNKNVTDNVTDIITIESNLDSTTNKFTVKVFDGKTLSDRQKQGITQFDGQNQELLLTQFSPFANQTFTPNAKASVAAGDIDGDGHSDIIVGVGGIANPLIEVYSGLDYHLITRISPFHHETGFTGTINLASGDIDGDNFDDVIVSQGSGGTGLVEVYSGRSIELKGSLNGKDTAHDTALLTQTFQPYGVYNGEIKVTSGYVLQRPDVPNGQAIQTYHANLTTMAVGNVPQGQEAVKIFTYLGGSHHGAAEDHSHSSTTGESMNEPEFRLDTQFTPKENLTGMLGSFADINGLSRGEPVIFGVDSSGKAELIRLQERNITMSVAAGGTLYTSGNDFYYGDTGSNNLFGSFGNDSIYGLSGNDQISGNEGNDLIAGGDDNDTLYGGKGDDTVSGNQGQDLLFGNLGNDTVHGGKGNDQIYGNQGQDVLTGDLGNDTVYGGKDNDLIYGNSGQDVLFGDAGNDTVYGGKDNDIIYGNSGQDSLFGDVGNDTIYGGKDNDLIYGNSGQDSLFGDVGNDTIYGGQENDTLNGGTGDDWLSGDLGNDLLQGGEGSDRFILAANKGSDTIIDFQNGIDSIILTGGLTFAQLTIAESSGSTLIRITSTNELLATLNGIPVSQIGTEDFIAS
ncbi:multicopper oxidase domain-containing protein [Phormidium sp. LEGE 05292]|uniref:multicopper oxidase domain-containing protein n=1 Tax=[Phormidium] sp. LEGE 05292 TaxID=767427 RepID=UPI00187FD579|nr:multicopper oxidase domain-containing protein [Phormidium sp. LEGE 05292]MBE9225383.1 multicopper oxidase domain-containing protein [Phormidium sp. LEGE 05292]